MKRIAANITSLVVVVLLFTAAGYSQFMQQVVLKADVPFEFSVGRKTFPAGEYRVVRTAPHTLALRDSKDRVLTSFVTSPLVTRNIHSTAALRFEFDGDRHALSQVWPGGVATGYELSIPKRVTLLAQQRSGDTAEQISSATVLGK